MEQSAHGETLALTSQSQSPETDFPEKTLREEAVKTKEKDDGQRTLERQGEENHSIPDSLCEKTDQEAEKEKKQDIGFDASTAEMCQKSDQGELEAKTCTETESGAPVQEKESVTDEVSVREGEHPVKDEGLTIKPDVKIVPEEKENPAVKQDSSDQPSETPTEDSRAETEDTVQEESITERSDRSTKESNKDKITQDKAAANAPTITSGSPRGRRKKTLDEGKEVKTPPRTRNAAAKNVPSKACEQKSSGTSGDVTFRETKEEEQEAPAIRTRAQAKKTVELTPVRKSTRGMKSECLGGEKKEECMKGNKAPSKRKAELSGPEPKRSASADIKLPPFDPKTPLVWG
ncbi:neurofilament medium polypeptide-like [Cyprinodon tularosa]|uniref:neurofilament medium polypeptide-like n=1 Tax=Cyprinodon tularosa TaxID=77115 RepID=UPI0018E28261|nr:neurofilament medium polypeptide-like [Cyprinodon tularosa]